MFPAGRRPSHTGIDCNTYVFHRNVTPASPTRGLVQQEDLRDAGTRTGHPDHNATHFFSRLWTRRVRRITSSAPVPGRRGVKIISALRHSPPNELGPIPRILDCEPDIEPKPDGAVADSSERLPSRFYKRKRSHRLTRGWRRIGPLLSAGSAAAGCRRGITS